MHIPDGYLSPQTFIPAWALMVPFWAWASKRVQRTLRMRQVPMLALAAAFSFVIMMFNVPFGASSGHAVGAVLIAILLGPWAAVIAVSLAMAVQALIFGDGGITALGANCLTMAVVMPFTGWGVYRLIAGAASATSRRRVVAAAIAGYLGLLVAAIVTAFLFGIQPYIATDAAGRALFNAYPLTVAIPIMAVEHLVVFGPIEALVTGLAIAYFQRSAPSMLTEPEQGGEQSTLVRNTAVGLAALILLSPLGLLATGTAWGEWDIEEMHGLIGYMPAGMRKFGTLWHALLPGYAAPGQESTSFLVAGLWYIVSALIGISVVSLVVWGISRLIARKESHDLPS